MRKHGASQTGSERMNKKKFPKAVLRTADEMRGGSAARSATVDNVIEMVPKPDISGAGATAADAAPIGAASALRLRKAVAIVERHANMSAVGGAIPVPIVNAAALAAILVRMVKSLSAHYGVPFERNRTRAIVISLMGGALPTGFATIAASAFTYLAPGYNLLGLAVSSVTSAAYARSIGRLYIEHFENGSTPDLQPIVWR
jgi:uncharacterized protein (DUF697 family)